MSCVHDDDDDDDDDDEQVEEEDDDDIFCLLTVDFSSYLLSTVFTLLQFSSIISDFSCHFSRKS